MRVSILVVLALGAPVAAAQAQTPECKKLPLAKRTLAKKILSSQHPYDCCDEKIADCLKQKKVCRLAVRLADNICRRVAKGQGEKAIIRALSRRARSMMPAVAKKAAIELKGWGAAGPADAKVTVVMYACARCPYCAKLTPRLHAAVTKGALKGKVRLVFKPFPIRNHTWSKEGGLAFAAAARLGGFWPFALVAYRNFTAFAPAKQSGWAAAAGLDAARFSALYKDRQTRKLLIASKKEGLRNKVKATPTFFIDGLRYVGEPGLAELLDVLGEAYERASGKTYAK